MLTATGTFEVKMAPTAPMADSGGLKRGRFSNDKIFSGDLVATSHGEMLTAMTPVEGSAGYVLIEQVTGSLSGRTGSFMLQHSSTMARGVPNQSIIVVPDSGTGQLTGLSGSMTVEVSPGRHAYTLRYTLPQ